MATTSAIEAALPSVRAATRSLITLRRVCAGVLPLIVSPDFTSREAVLARVLVELAVVLARVPTLVAVVFFTATFFAVTFLAVVLVVLAACVLVAFLALALLAATGAFFAAAVAVVATDAKELLT